MSANLYQEDFYAWTQHQAAKLRAGDYAGLDSVNLAEKLDSLGKAERRQLGNRLTLIGASARQGLLACWLTSQSYPQTRK